MKTLLISSVLGLSSLGIFNLSDNHQHSHSETSEQSYRCAYIKRDGNQCRNYAQKYSAYCWSHNR